METGSTAAPTLAQYEAEQAKREEFVKEAMKTYRRAGLDDKDAKYQAELVWEMTQP